MYQKSHHTISVNKIFYALLIFMAAYMTTIRVQAQETYSSKASKDAAVTGLATNVKATGLNSSEEASVATVYDR